MVRCDAARFKDKGEDIKLLGLVGYFWCLNSTDLEVRGSYENQ